jgi:hypothetical protein
MSTISRRREYVKTHSKNERNTFEKDDERAPKNQHYHDYSPRSEHLHHRQI